MYIQLNVEITRKINGKTGKYPVYTKEQAQDKKLDYIYWRQAKIGDWGLTDDGYVAECYDRKNYTDKNGRVKTFVKLTCGVGWDSGFSKINFLTNHEYGVYSKTNPKRTWDAEESGKVRAKNTVTAYAQMVFEDRKVDYDALGKIQFAVDNILRALTMAENKGDVNNFLKANDYLMDLLEMKPNKQMITDTIQVDMTKQIADTIAKEEKKLTLQRKSETNEAAK